MALYQLLKCKEADSLLTDCSVAQVLCSFDHVYQCSVTVLQNTVCNTAKCWVPKMSICLLF